MSYELNFKNAVQCNFRFVTGSIDNHKVVVDGVTKFIADGMTKFKKFVYEHTKDPDWLQALIHYNVHINHVKEVYDLADWSDRNDSKKQKEKERIISKLVKKNYPVEDFDNVCGWLTMLYYLMIAEEMAKKENPRKLSGKMIKYLAAYQVLVRAIGITEEDRKATAKEAGNWSWGKKFRKDLLPLYKELGLIK